MGTTLEEMTRDSTGEAGAREGGTTRPSILLVSAAFPPSTEVGAARWEGFAPFLSSAGWRLQVLMECPHHGAVLDRSRLARLGDSVSVHMVPRRDPEWRRRSVDMVNFLRRRRAADESGGLDVADRMVVSSRLKTANTLGASSHAMFSAAVAASRNRAWITDATAASGKLLQQQPASFVISSGPPHDAHVAASIIARRAGVPHIVDLRDPWIGNPADPHQQFTLIVSPTGKRAAARVFRSCAAVLANTPQAASALLRQNPSLAGRVHVVLNGSDRTPRPPRVLSPTEPFLIVHAGTLYLDRDPRPFLRAVSKARAMLGTTGERIKIVFMGRRAAIDGRPLPEWAAEFGLAGCFEERGFGTRDEAAELMDAAAMLVAFQGATPTQVPAKIFDYVSNAATLLAVTDPTSATASILEGTSAQVAAMDDENAICNIIRESVERCAQGVPIVPVDADGRFAREAQASVLLAVLKNLSSQVSA